MRVCIAWPNTTDGWYTAFVADLATAGHDVTQVNPTSVGVVTTAYDGAGCDVLLLPTYTANADYRAAVNAGRPCVTCDRNTTMASQWAGDGNGYSPSSAELDFVNSGHYIAGPLNNTANVAIFTAADWQIKWNAVGSLETIATNADFGTPGDPIIGAWEVGGTYGGGSGTAGARTVLHLATTSTEGLGARMNATGRALLIRALEWAAGATGDTEVELGAITTGSPTVSQLALGQVHSLALDAISVGAPTVSQLALGQAHAVELGLISATPTVSQLALGQVHGLAFEGIATSAPTVSVLTLGQAHALGLGGITTPSPLITQLALGQVHALGLNGIQTGQPTISQLSLAGVASVEFDPIDIGQPTVSEMALGQKHALAFSGIVIGQPTVSQLALGQNHSLAFGAITTGLPTISQMHLNADEAVPSQAFVGLTVEQVICELSIKPLPIVRLRRL